MGVESKWKRLLGCACLLAVAAAGPSGGALRAESIWHRRAPTAAFLYGDNVASRVGDSLTVLIADQSSFKKKGERQMDKSSAHKGSLSMDVGHWSLSQPVGTKQSSSREFKSSSEYNSSRQFVDSISVTVVDRLPNGNLVIAGRSERHIADELVITILTGIIRPEDISGSNTIPSTRVARLNIFYQTSGVSNAYMNQGWANRILNFIWPF